MPRRVHLALAPQAVAGQPTWVAAVDRRWLRAELAALEKAECLRRPHRADRPGPTIRRRPLRRNRRRHGDPAQAVVLNWAHADGVVSLRLQGGLARACCPRPLPAGARWSATPAAAAAAERWLGAPRERDAPGQRALQAARSLWNLRQFDLARRTRGARALRDSLRQFFSPAWRPVRWRPGGLVVAQIVGLNRGPGTSARRSTPSAPRSRRCVKTTYPRVSASTCARRRRRDAARNHSAAHRGRQARRRRPRSPAAGRRHRPGQRPPAGRDACASSPASSPWPPPAGARRRSSSSAASLRPAGWQRRSRRGPIDSRVGPSRPPPA